VSTVSSTQLSHPQTTIVKHVGRSSLLKPESPNYAHTDSSSPIQPYAELSSVFMVTCRLCQAVMTKRELYQHLKTCKKMVKCTLCGEEVLRAGTSKQRKLYCKECNHCGQCVPNIKKHIAVCASKPISCGICGVMINLGKYSAHFEECKTKTCDHCKVEVLDFKAHIRECPGAPTLTCIYCTETEPK
jgi:hypothetical protein